MRVIANRCAILAATAMCVVLTSPAVAQETGGDAVGSGAIIVTARRMEERLQDVPISITVYDQEDISKRNIVNSGDLATYTPSLSLNSRFGPEKASFAIRGFVQDLATQPSVGVYFADVVAPRSGGSTTSGNGVGVGQLFDLQSVQVLKGPQGTLFGRNTTGGAVLLVPRKPTGQLEGYIEGSLGDYDLRRVQAVVNLPLADTFKVRLGVDRMKREGYLDNQTDIGPSHFGDVDYIAARLSVLAELTPDLENYTIANYTLSDNNGIVPKVLGCNEASPFAPFACGQVTRQEARGDGFWDIENTETDPKIRMESWQVINTTTWLASDSLTIKNIASYGEFRETARLTLEGEAFLLPNGTPFIEVIRLNNTPGYFNSIQSTWTEELQFQGQTSNGSFRWQAGGYYEASDPMGFTSQSTSVLLRCPDLQALQCIDLIGGRNISRPYQKTWFRSRGLYAQGTYEFTDQLAVTAGARYTWDRMTHRYDQFAIFFPAPGQLEYRCTNPVRVPDTTVTAPDDHFPCAVKFTAKSDKPTWMIDVEYKPIPDVMLYAKWARGYRAGGAASANILFETWEPEKVDTYEVGAKTSFRAGPARGYFNLTGFYNDFRDQQIQATLIRAPTSPLVGGSAIINAGKSRIWGVEVDTSVTLFDQLKLDGAYTYLNTKVLELDVPVLGPELVDIYSAIVPTAEVGSPLALSPKNRFTITGTYMVPLDDSIGDISFGATFVHTDEQVVSLATAPQFQKLKPTDLLNLNASWDSVMGSSFDLAFFMTNVTNEKYNVSVNNAFFSFGLESGVINEPRMYGLRLKYRFGS
ncbi:hypothetical protein GCM10011494_39070 [Novosphingobium endophyticum]|uniref:TonB-dependent receptor n=1 Tax=Novosphingobium endophyticum TaxID=1955250 RepID=A0A916TWP2_9SPHN|nr:TonB-dependent receptor [Novosphingobium endophyticum]GGC16384.1 hypothetical protein GCM10011494_39070 [Novosphingobium endophyticum]